MNITETKSVVVTVPAGRYYLGDPCYVVPDKLWHPLLESCGYFDDSPVGEVDGHKVLAFSTRYGDGEYSDQHGNTYGVDAGMIGLVPEAMVDADAVRKDYGGHIPCTLVEFRVPTKCWSDNGVLHFGNRIINTAE